MTTELTFEKFQKVARRRTAIPTPLGVVFSFFVFPHFDTHIYMYMYIHVNIYIHVYIYRAAGETSVGWRGLPLCMHTRDSVNEFCSALQHTATHCNTLQHIAAHCSILQHTAAHCSTLPHTTPHYNTLQHTTTHYNTLQHTATHYNTL